MNWYLILFLAMLYIVPLILINAILYVDVNLEKSLLKLHTLDIGGFFLLSLVPIANIFFLFCVVFELFIQSNFTEFVGEIIKNFYKKKP